MGAPREAVHTAMLATSIRIEGAIEADIGRLVARDDLAGCIERHRGLERRKFFKTLPAVVKRNPRLGLIAAAGVGLRASAAPPPAFDGDCKLRKGRRCTRRFGGRRDRRVLERM